MQGKKNIHHQKHQVQDQNVRFIRVTTKAARRRISHTSRLDRGMERNH